MNFDSVPAGKNITQLSERNASFKTSWFEEFLPYLFIGTKTSLKFGKAQSISLTGKRISERFCPTISINAMPSMLPIG